jgi:hypothetical protein
VSYIRCLSNPEGLYIWDIWGEKSGRVAITTITDGGHLIKYMPRHVFHNLMRRWRDGKYHDESIRYRGGSLVLDPDSKYGKWDLFYKGWDRPVKCWEVTWMYVATQNDFGEIGK